MPRVDRKLALLDLMILVAATAIGLSGALLIWDCETVSHYKTGSNAPGPDDPPSYRIFYHPYHVLLISFPVVAAWTWALSLLALRGPRPGADRLPESPGVAACWAATIAMTICGGLALVKEYRAGYHGWWVFRARRDIGDAFYYSTIDAFTPIGLSVIAAWAMAVVGDRRSPGGNRVDRAGLAMGATWIALAFTKAMVVPY